MRPQLYLASLVEDPDPVAFVNAAFFSVYDVYLQQLRVLHLLNRRDIGKRAVEEVIRLPCQKFQRELPGAGRQSRFVRRDKRDDGVEALGLQIFTVQLRFAAGCGKAALGEGQKGAIAEVEAYVTFSFEALPRKAIEPFFPAGRPCNR